MQAMSMKNIQELARKQMRAMGHQPEPFTTDCNMVTVQRTVANCKRCGERAYAIRDIINVGFMVKGPAAQKVCTKNPVPVVATIPLRRSS